MYITSWRVIILYLILSNFVFANYLVVLKHPLTVRSFLKYELKFPIAQRVKRFISRSFLIGNFSGFSGNFTEATLERLKNCPLVAEITPDVVFKALRIEEQTDSPTHLTRLSQADYYKHDRTSYFYDSKASGKNVNVYIIDLGIQTDHPEFEKRAFHGKDFTGEGGGDTNGHGTHVAGIVGSRTYGVAKNAKLYEVKTLDKTGQGSLSVILGAIEFAVNHRKKALVPGVANLSLGAIKNSVLNRVIDAACDTGLVVVVAAGNLNVDACYTLPASALKSITVGAIDDSTMGIAEFSNWGQCVDIFTGGVSVASVDINRLESPLFLSGTSMSSPIIAGLVANMLSLNISPFDVKDQLLAMATKNMMSWRSLRGKRHTPNLVAYNGHDPYIYADSDTDTDSESDSEEGS